MPTRSAPPSIGETDYDAIEAAVMETVRGRWFLTEFARRNRHADTDMLLGAIERLAAVARGEEPTTPDPRIHGGLLDMAKAIADIKAEIAALKPEAAPGRFDEATEELDLVVQATETATSDILASAEHVQEVAWTLREQGLEPQACDFLDAQATAIYTACSFQDLTGQRTRKVIDVLRYMDERINAMIAIWGSAPAATAAPAPPNMVHGRTGLLLDLPAKHLHGLDQTDIDVVMSRGAAAVRPPLIGAPATVTELVADYPATADPFPAFALDEHDDEPEDWPEEIVVLDDSGASPSGAAAPALRDPLAPIRALSYEEKIALFS